MEDFQRDKHFTARINVFILGNMKRKDSESQLETFNLIDRSIVKIACKFFVHTDV